MARYFTSPWNVTLSNGRRVSKGLNKIEDSEFSDLVVKARGVKELDEAEYTRRVERARLIAEEESDKHKRDERALLASMATAPGDPVGPGGEKPKPKPKPKAITTKAKTAKDAPAEDAPEEPEGAPESDASGSPDFGYMTKTQLRQWLRQRDVDHDGRSPLAILRDMAKSDWNEHGAA